jgi:hypothetical protein
MPRYNPVGVLGILSLFFGMLDKSSFFRGEGIGDGEAGGP